MQPQAMLLIIQHVPHERLGAFEDAFRQAGCGLQFLNIYEQQPSWPDLEQVHGMVSLGGPQSVYEQVNHSWMVKELTLLQEAVRRELPVLGVCLGAQLLAAALGARVAKNPQKEIGWYPLMREPEAAGDPLCEPFGQTETVFQWHGDTFALPKGAVRLFSSPLCQNQAFRYGQYAYGLQFHVEVTEAMIRAWMQKNRSELARLRGVIDPETIRSQSPAHLPRLQELSQHIATTFCRLVTSQCGVGNSECGVHKSHSAFRIPHSKFRHSPRGAKHARSR